MFEQFQGFDRIWVSGPQRSGTRFCSKIVADDLGIRRIDEVDFAVDDTEMLSAQFNGSPVVVQCPGLSHVLHKVATDKDCVVMMIREVDDILASEKRIDWGCAGQEWEKCIREWGSYLGSRRTIPLNTVAELKYLIWTFQKDLIPNWQEIQYESLSAHPRWIAKEARRKFGAFQTD